MGYQTRISVFTSGVTTLQRFLNADPRRYAVRFAAFGLAAFTIEPTPGPIPNGYPTGSSLNAPVIYEWPKYPSWVTGEWYVECGVGTEISIWECLKVR